MIRVLVTGSGGHMGRFVLEQISLDPRFKVVGGIDRVIDHTLPFPVVPHFADFTDQADVIIDFSHHSMVSEMLDYIEKTNTPAVICTTGIQPEDEKRIEELSKKVALFKSGNMSLGINVLIDLAERATRILGDSFDIEIIEKHHHRKVDAPSGTAFMLAEAINASADGKYNYVYGRQGNSCKRAENELGIHAIRGGSIVGEHDILFAGLDEVIEIRHSAGSRAVFAKGALEAAAFIVGKEPQLYNMRMMLGSIY